MAGDTKDVELRIRARDFSQKTLDQVVDSLKELEKAQGAQLEAAKRGEAGTKALEAAYQKLESAAQALVSQHSLTKTFEAQSRVLEETKAKVEAAKEAHAAFANSLGDAETRTKKQESALRKLANAVGVAERAQGRAEDRLTTTTARLAEFGISTTNLAQEQQRIVESVNRVNEALARQDAAIEGVNQAMIERQARAAKEAQMNQLWSGLIDQITEKERALAKAQAEAAAKEKEAQAATEAALVAREKQLQLDRQFETELAKVVAQQERAKAAQDAQRMAMNKAADQAEDLVRLYAKMSKAGATGSGATSLADQIAAINDPGAKAKGTMDGLAAAIEKVEKAADNVIGPVKGYKEAAAAAATAQESLNRIAGQVDAYERQMRAVRKARAEFVAARTTVTELATALRSGNGTPEMVAALGRAETAMKRAGDAMAQQRQKAHELREALRSAGVQTVDLGAVKGKLVEQAEKARSATDRLTEAFKKNGAEVERAGNTLSKFFGGSGERTTLSYMQRLRGEVLALSASFVGIQATLGLAKDVIDVAKQSASIESRLSVVVGNDAKAIAAEWDYLARQSDRFGLSFQKVAAAYAKFAVSSKSNGQTLQETRFIFEQVAGASAKLKLSTEETEGVLRAFEQMLNKGKIQAEELTQQLGDRMPGVMALAAKAVGKTTAELMKMMENGELTSDYVINIAREMGKAFNVGDQAADNIVAASARYETSVFMFKKALGDAGFIDAYVKFLNELSAVLNSREGTELAQTLSDAFSGVVEALRWCAEHVDELRTAFGILIGIQVAKFAVSTAAAILALGRQVAVAQAAVVAASATMGGMGAALGTMGAAAGMSAAGVATLTRSVALLSGALKILGRSIPVIGVAMAAWGAYEIATAGKNKVDGEADGEKYAEEFIDGVEKITEGTADPGTGGSQSKLTQAALKKKLENEKKESERIDLNARKRDAKGSLDERLKIAGEPFEAYRKQARKDITDKKQLDATLEAIDKEHKARLKAETAAFHAEQAGASSAAGSKRVQLLQQVHDELARIEDDLAKRDAKLDPMATFEQRLSTRMADIAHEYDKLQRKIATLARTSPKDAAAASARLAEFVKQRQELEAIKVKQEELNRLEKALSDATSMRAARLGEVKAQYNAGMLTQDEMLQKTKDVNDIFGLGIEKSATSLREFADAIKDLLDPAKYELLVSRVNTALAQNQPGQQNNGADREASEARLNEVLQTRANMLAMIQQQERLGLATNQQAVEAINQTNAAFKEQIIANATELVNYLELSRNPANAAAVDQQIAKMRELITETQHAGQAFTELEMVAFNSLMNGVVNTIDSMAESIAGFIVGQKSASEMFADMGRASLQFFAQFLRDIALAIIKQQLFNMLKNSGNPYLMAAGVALSAASGAGQKHSGGMVSQPGGRVRRVDPAIFAGAQRLHSGGIPGLQPNEVPTILEKSEEVLTRDDPRHVLNGGKGGGGGGGGGGGQRFVLVDDRSRVAEAMQSAEGEQVTMIHLRRNIATLKQMLK